MIHINNIISSIVFLNKNGKLHRLDGPAVIKGDKRYWYENNKLHRLDGPAVIEGNYEEWYIEGKKYNKPEYHRKLKEMGILYDFHHKN